MAAFDDVLYRWISLANRKREDLDLPPGAIEDSVGLLRTVLGTEYLEELLVQNTGPISVFDDEINPLRKWLHSGRIDDHIINVLELASYLRTFQHDTNVADKVQKMKRDRFWPIFFELAMATRLKRACHANQDVVLNAESSDSVGDFTIKVGGFDAPCECSRLGKSTQVPNSLVLVEYLFHHIEHKTKNIPIPLCIKIRSESTVTGHTYNSVLRLVKRAINAARAQQLPTLQCDGQTTVSIELLTAASEIPNSDTNWEAGVRFFAVNAKSHAEVSEKYDRGEKMERFEMVRVFVKFAKPRVNQLDDYSRLTSKIRKKMKQIKDSEKDMGKIVFLQVPFSLRNADDEKLKAAVREAGRHSQSALAIYLAHREVIRRNRFYFSHVGAFREMALATKKQAIRELGEILAKGLQSERSIDPILGEPYRRS